MKRKESFISDKRRISYLSAIYNRIYRGQSVLIEGDYGVGKSRFLKLLKPKKLHGVWAESLFNIHEILSSILKDLNYDTTATYRRTPKYLKTICSLTDFGSLVFCGVDFYQKNQPVVRIFESPEFKEFTQ